jgi:hypothetical protein
MRHKDAILPGSQCEHLGISDALQMGRMSREEIERGLAPQTASHDRMVEAGIRQEADHASAW